jgi:hypothetical protein
MPEPTTLDIEEDLARIADLHGLEWAIKCDVAHECCWAVELRITLKPNSRTGPDRSLVFYSAGEETPDDGIVQVYRAARADLPDLGWGL